MPDIEFFRAEIERMRYRIQRQRGEIRQLQCAGIPSTSVMLNKIDDLCTERDRLKTKALRR
jgi:hypothetical protein